MSSLNDNLNQLPLPNESSVPTTPLPSKAIKSDQIPETVQDKQLSQSIIKGIPSEYEIKPHSISSGLNDQSLSSISDIRGQSLTGHFAAQNELFPMETTILGQPLPLSFERLIEFNRHQFLINSRSCLSNLSRVEQGAVAHFCKDLKKMAEEINNGAEKLKPGSGKEAEREFLVLTMKDFVKEVAATTRGIINSHLTAEEKSKQVNNLLFMSEALQDLSLVQYRFGGLLPFHNVVHTGGVALGSAQIFKGTPREFQALCAGAGHDLYMAYKNPPPLAREARGQISDKERINLREQKEKFSQVLNLANAKLMNQETQVPPHVQLGGDFVLIRDIKAQSKQNREAGINENDSERKSYDHVEQRLFKFQEVIKQTLLINHLPENSEIAKKLEQAVSDSLPFIRESIFNTVPALHNFAAGGIGKKFNSISNVNILYNPAELSALRNDPLKRDLIIALDRMISEVNPAGPNYTQTVTDLELAKQFYKALNTKIAAAKSNQTGELTLDNKRIIKNEILNEMQNKPQYFLNDFQMDNPFIQMMMPSFNDPASFIDPTIDSSSALYSALRESPELALHLAKRFEGIGTAITDLNALLEKGADQNWAIDESIALIAEEQPYDLLKFQNMHGKIMNNPELVKAYPKGLAESSFHQDLALRKLDQFFSDQEKIDLTKFLAISYDFIKEQAGFAKGRIGIVKTQIYEPLKSLAQVQKEGLLSDISLDLGQCLKNFEESYVVNGRLREDGLEGVKEVLNEAKDPVKLSQMILGSLSKRSGTSNGNYINKGQLKRSFISHLSNPLVDNRIWAS